MEAELEPAVVDRITDGHAVLLVGEDEREVVVPVAELPPDVGAGTWVQLRPGPPPVVVGAGTALVDREDLRSRMERLRRDRRGGRFGPCDPPGHA